MPAFSPTREQLERRLGRAMSQAIADYNMIDDGDRILVAVSGGKDSHTLLYLLRQLQQRAPVRFELKAYDFALVEEDTYSIVTEKIPRGKTYCSLCSRLRRGILYRIAEEFGCRKIALGHHRDDLLQTLLLNLMFAGQLASMAPRLVASPPHADRIVIRPLAYCGEENISTFAELAAFPILPCDLCGSQEHLQRKRVGRLIDDLERERPGTKAVMLAALQNVRPSRLLDRGLLRALDMHLPHEQTGPSENPTAMSELHLVRKPVG
jgi:tRNA 2-thiocytidine biosynthesis protein TtcA